MVDSTLDKSAPGPWSGWLHGLLGVIIFSGSLPATRLAVQDMDPLLLTFLRASIAGLLAIALLVGFRQKRPRLAQLVSLIIVSSGVVPAFRYSRRWPCSASPRRIRLCSLACCR